MDEHTVYRVRREITIPHPIVLRGWINIDPMEVARAVVTDKSKADRVLEKLGMERLETDGSLLKWELKRTYESLET